MQKYQSVTLKSLIQKIFILVIFSFFLESCSPLKHIGPDEVFLKSNSVKIHSRVIEQEQLTPYLKQRANTQALWVIKLKMQKYLAFNDSIIAIKNEKKRIKLAKRNTKREAAGKDTINFRPVLSYRLKEEGEAPVVFDQTYANETARQFHKILFNNGYFHNKVNIEYLYNLDSTKVKVIYTAEEGPQFTLNKIAIVIDDPNLTEAVKKANQFSTLHKGEPYNTSKIESERSRFTSEMRNQGYYYFSKEYLLYEVDSSITGNIVNIKTIIKNPSIPNDISDSTKTGTHQKFKIGTIVLNTSFNSNFTDNPEDSIHFENLTFINLSRLRYNPHSFVNKLFYDSGDYYSQRNESRTYTRLSGLNNFKYINIGFQKADVDSNILNCNILMTPFPSQSIGVEVEGTNTSGNLGVSGYLSYLHRNTFGNAEEFKVRFKGGLEAQQTNTADVELNPDGFNIFNTVEYGVETSLIFQDLILPGNLKDKILRRFNRPKTSINFILNYQNRPDFERFLTNASFGYMFTNKKVNTNEFFIYPIDISYITITKSEAFTKRLDDLKNPLLNATYDNQFIAGSRLMESWTNKTTEAQRSFVLNRVQFELAGNLLHLGSTALHNPIDTNSSVSDPFYTIGNVRYAQFVKIQNDLHYTANINRGHSIAYRLLGGIGVPYGNSKVLPYDRSFYGGGANDMRGWQARSLGPGGQLDDTLRVGIDQVADIKIQIGLEYRFNIFKALEGGLFMDAGNIWLLRKDDARKLAEFNINRFYKEIAVSLGVGARFNFGFLLVRLDWGLKIFDPALPEGQRFTVNKGDYLTNYKTHTNGRAYQYSVFNLGIGYPF